MTLRTFQDSSGSLWTVWDTVRSSDTPVTTALVDGWLTFDSASEKRRLAPIPRGWEALPDPELERFLARAQPVVRGRAARVLESAMSGHARRPDAAVGDPSRGGGPRASADAPAAATPGRPPAGATLRTFIDEAGLVWSVWAVRPGASPNAEDAAERRADAGDARRRPIAHPERRLQVRSEFARGWLAFHAASGARRRLMPIPERWQTLPDGELERFCRDARPMPDAER